MTCLVPSERVITPRSAPRALPLAVGAEPVRTGGHSDAQPALQLELAPLSASYMYTVRCFGPAARIVPSLPCLVLIVSRALAAVLELLAAVVCAGGLAAVGPALVAVLLLPPPHPATASAPVAIAPSAKVFLIVPPAVVDRPSGPLAARRH